VVAHPQLGGQSTSARVHPWRYCSVSLACSQSIDQRLVRVSRERASQVRLHCTTQYAAAAIAKLQWDWLPVRCSPCLRDVTLRNFSPSATGYAKVADAKPRPARVAAPRQAWCGYARRAERRTWRCIHSSSQGRAHARPAGPRRHTAEGKHRALALSP